MTQLLIASMLVTLLISIRLLASANARRRSVRMVDDSLNSDAPVISDDEEEGRGGHLAGTRRVPGHSRSLDVLGSHRRFHRFCSCGRPWF